MLPVCHLLIALQTSVLVVVCADLPAAPQASKFAAPGTSIPQDSLQGSTYSSDRQKYVTAWLHIPAEYGSNAATPPAHGIHLGLHCKSHTQQPPQQLHPQAHCIRQSERCCYDCAVHQQHSAAWLAAAAPAQSLLPGCRHPVKAVWMRRLVTTMYLITYPETSLQRCQKCFWRGHGVKGACMCTCTAMLAAWLYSKSGRIV